jgi:large subunit ribosomal protein L24
MLSAKSSKKKKIALPLHYHIKKGDTVVVIAGKSKGVIGTVQHIFRNKGKVIVEGANIVKKAVRPNTAAGEAGGLIEMEAPLHVCKVMLYDTKNAQASRSKVVTIGGKSQRVSKKSSNSFDN